jgi:ABC-type multidrug transport system ATPase subunit
LEPGEMIVGPSRALFMDEISTGLDSSTTFQIVSCLQQVAHISESTILVSLLQPAPETYDLFNDIILMAEGKIAYHGSKSCIMNFFESCGFKCLERKRAADFLQEVHDKSTISSKSLTNQRRLFKMNTISIKYLLEINDLKFKCVYLSWCV